MSTEPSPASDQLGSVDFDRRQRTVDMMLSMHSLLRDRYARWAAILDLVLFAGSIVITATLLLDPRILLYIGISEDAARLLVALASIVLFFLSIVVLRVDWKEKAARHQRAGSLLSDLKARGRVVAEHVTREGLEAYRGLYDFTMAGIEPIPERDFLPLKAEHRRKIALSRAIDRFPNIPVWLLRLRLLSTDTRSAWDETSART